MREREIETRKTQTQNFSRLRARRQIIYLGLAVCCAPASVYLREAAEAAATHPALFSRRIKFFIKPNSCIIIP